MHEKYLGSRPRGAQGDVGKWEDNGNNIILYLGSRVLSGASGGVNRRAMTGAYMWAFMQTS